jgi:hypothetical protein
MTTHRSYTPQEARALVPEVRAVLLQIAMERRVEPARASAESIQALLDHLDTYGVVVRDLESGLVDFPTVRDGEPAWLCWRLADADLAYWHTTREGFASRRPL